MRAHLLLVLGLLVSTSTATAQPEEDGSRTPFRGHGERYHRHREWTQVVTPTPTTFGTEYIIISRNAGFFRSLRIDALSGTVVLRRISVFTYRHGWKTFHVRRTLTRFNPSFYIDLGTPTRIRQIAVTTDRRFAGSYAIYASPGQVRPVLISAR